MMFIPAFNTWTAVVSLLVIIACIFLYKRKTTEEDPLPTTARIVGDQDTLLLQTYTLEHGKIIIVEAQKGLNHDQWRALEAAYSPWLVNVCKTAMKKAAKHPTKEQVLPEADYISATVLMQQLVSFASEQLDAPVTHEKSEVPEKKGLPIKQMTLTKDNVSTIIDELRQGQRMLIINIASVESEEDLKRALKLIKRTAEAQEGSVLGLGTDWLVATHAIPIKTQGGEMHGTV
jgi:SepF-like predicted cell division protein (DUF552 family)